MRVQGPNLLLLEQNLELAFDEKTRFQEKFMTKTIATLGDLNSSVVYGSTGGYSCVGE